MKIIYQYALVGLLIAGLAAANFALAWQHLDAVGTASAASRDMGRIQAALQEIKDMQNAVSTDVTEALDATQKGNREAYDRSVAASKTHFQRLNAALDAIRRQDTSADFKTLLTRTANQFAEYQKAAEGLIYTGINDAAVNAPRLDAFAVQFASLDKTRQEYEATARRWQADADMQQGGMILDTRTSLAFFSGAVALLALLIPIFIWLGISRPTAKMISAMRQLAAGDITAQIPFTARKNELGALARAVQECASQQRQKTAQAMAEAFEEAMKALAETVASSAAEIDAAARSVAASAETHAGDVTALSAQVEGTTRNVQTMAGATVQLSTTVHAIHEQIARAAALAAAAAEESTRADSVAQVLTVDAQKVNEALEAINIINGKINLLALNATIDAMRAGEAGKPFSAVAVEVKNLAGQAASATAQIGQYIGSIRGAGGEAAGAIRHIGDAVREMNEISAAIAKAAEEQGAATRHIAGSVEQAAQNTGDALRSAAGVSILPKATGESAQHMSAAAARLSERSKALLSEAGQFLAGLRA